MMKFGPGRKEEKESREKGRERSREGRERGTRLKKTGGNNTYFWQLFW
jgi:hypothetical protein